MRFRVWEEGIEKKDGDVLLRLKSIVEGGVVIQIVNERGKWKWDLAHLQYGKIAMDAGIGKDTYNEGLELDEFNRIKLIDRYVYTDEVEKLAPIKNGFKPFKEVCKEIVSAEGKEVTVDIPLPNGKSGTIRYSDGKLYYHVDGVYSVIDNQDRLDSILIEYYSKIADKWTEEVEAGKELWEVITKVALT